MFKIALNAGHGLKTAGKRCLKSIDPSETREWVLNARICEKVSKLLKGYTGYELIRVDDVTGQKDISLTTRTSKANKWGADFYLSIHHNAGIKGGTGGGIEAYTYTKVSDKTIQWQNDLYNSLIKHTGLKGNRSDGTRSANFGECRMTNMPAVLLELGYMDSATDVPIILSEDFANKCATAIVEVLAQKGGLKKAVEKPAAPVEKTIYDIAKEVVAGKWGNGAVRKKKLTDAGYNYSAIQAAVNSILNKNLEPAKKSNEEIAKEVLAGKWGNGFERKKRLKAAGYDYSAIQKIVNKLAK